MIFVAIRERWIQEDNRGGNHIVRHSNINNYIVLKLGTGFISAYFYYKLLFFTI
jgi:hypothetical protein